MRIFDIPLQQGYEANKKELHQDLKLGDKFSAKIIHMDPNQVTLKLKDDTIIKANTLTDLNKSVGEQIKLVVKDVKQDSIIVETIKGDESSNLSPKLSKALSNLSAKPNEQTLKIIETMLEDNIEISDKSLEDLKTNMKKFKTLNLTAKKASFLKKNNVPITKTNINMLNNFLEKNFNIANSIKNIQDNLQNLKGETTQKISKTLKVLDAFETVSKLIFALNELDDNINFDKNQTIQTKENLLSNQPNKKEGLNLSPKTNIPKPNSGEILSQTQDQKAYNSESNSNLNETQKNNVATNISNNSPKTNIANKILTQEIKHTMTKTNETNDLQKQPLTSNNSLEHNNKIDNKISLVLSLFKEDPDGFLNKNPQELLMLIKSESEYINVDLSKELNLDKSKNVDLSKALNLDKSKNIDVSKELNFDVSKDENISIKQSNTFNNNKEEILDLLPKKTFVKKDQNTKLESLKPADTRVEIKNIFNDSFINLDNEISPKNLDIKYLYQKITAKLTLLKDLADSSKDDGLKEISTSISKLNNQLDFLNNINNNNTYAQIPIYYKEHKTGELYILNKNTKNTKNTNLGTTVFLSLDTINIGRFETLVNVKNNDLKICLRLENEKIISYVKNNIKTLYNLLEKTDYRIIELKCKKTTEKINPLNIEETINKEFAQNNGSLDLRI